jgi:hypothetical protein
LIEYDEFIGCVKVGVGDLEKALAKKHKLKPKEVTHVFKTHLEPFIERTQKAGSLEREED